MIVVSQKGDFAHKIQGSVGWREENLMVVLENSNESGELPETTSKTVYAVRIDGYRMGYFSTPEQAKEQYDQILHSWLRGLRDLYEIPQDVAKNA